MLKRSRSENSDYAIVSQSSMPLVTKRIKANQRGLYKKKRYYKRGESSLTSQLNKLQNDVHHVVCSASTDISINGSTGFNVGPSANTSIQFSFNQRSVFYALGGNTPVAIFNFANAGSYGVIFDQWKLEKVVVQVLFSTNSATVNSGSQNFPIVYCVTDTNDVLPLNDLNTAVAYGNCKIMQMGTASNNGIQTISLPNPSVEIDAITTGGLVNSGIVRRSPWLNTDTPTIQHNGIKMFVNTPIGTGATAGVMTLIFRCFYAYKNIV